MPSIRHLEILPIKGKGENWFEMLPTQLSLKKDELRAKQAERSMWKLSKKADFFLSIRKNEIILVYNTKAVLHCNDMAAYTASS